VRSCKLGGNCRQKKGNSGKNESPPLNKKKATSHGGGRGVQWGKKLEVAVGGQGKGMFEPEEKRKHPSASRVKTKGNLVKKQPLIKVTRGSDKLVALGKMGEGGDRAGGECDLEEGTGKRVENQPVTR